MQKTIGGDRLGAGNKMKVHLHGYERSTHDLSQLWRSTMSAGTLVPFLCIPMKPGDTFDITLGAEMNTHPTIGPLFGSAKLQLDLFLCPVRLYQAQLHNNALGIGRNMAAVKLPQIVLTARPFDLDSATIDIDNCQINPSCILKYLGISGVAHRNTVDGEGERMFNALPILSYWDIYKNYFANKQEELGAVIHTPFEALINTWTSLTILPDGVGSTPVTIPGIGTPGYIPLNASSILEAFYTGTEPNPSQVIVMTDAGEYRLTDIFINFVTDTGAGTITAQFDPSRWGFLTIYYLRFQANTDVGTGLPEVATFDLDNLDEIRNKIIQWTTPANPFLVDENSPEPFKWLCEVTTGVPANVLSSQEGLGLKTYQSDLFNNWIRTEWIDEINAIASVSTAGDEFTVESLVLARKVYDMLNRIAISDGSYKTWIEVVHDVDFYTQCYSPMYMGGLIKELVFQEVVSNSEAESGQPLGTLAGKGVLAKKHKGGSAVIRTSEHAYLIGIVSITPRVDYSQGNNWDTHLETMDDFHKSPMDAIGYQESINEDRAWWSTSWVTTEYVQTSAGKLPAWINYQTAVNKTYGNFAIAENEMFMTFNRRFEAGIGGIQDLTTYIDPSKFNFIFAQTALDSQNYWCQIATNITARRKMSARQIPNL